MDVLRASSRANPALQSPAGGRGHSRLAGCPLHVPLGRILFQDPLQQPCLAGPGCVLTFVIGVIANLTEWRTTGVVATCPGGDETEPIRHLQPHQPCKGGSRNPCWALGSCLLLCSSLGRRYATVIFRPGNFIFSSVCIYPGLCALMLHLGQHAPSTDPS